MPSLTATDYISWVQRSLNRLLGERIRSNGSDSPYYRDSIEEFQLGYALPITRDIGPSDQNEIIKANHKTPEYVDWAQEVLRRTGASTGSSGVAGFMSEDTRDSIKSFQAYIGLKDDGWIGARTETEMIRESGLTPPGHVVAPIIPPKPKPRPVVPTRPMDPLPIDKRVDRVLGGVQAEAIHNPSVYPDSIQRKRVICFTQKMKMRGADKKYIRSYQARSFVLGTEFAYGKYTPDEISFNAREILTNRVRKLPFSYRTDKEVMRKLVLDLYYEVVIGLATIKNLYDVHGDSPPAHDLHRWAYNRQNGITRRNSILACFNIS